MNLSPGLGESNSRREPYSPVYSPTRTSKSYDQPHINGQVLLEEIQETENISVDQISKRNDASNHNTSKHSSKTTPRRWRLIPTSCTCPIHSNVATNSSFMSDIRDEMHSEYCRSFAERDKDASRTSYGYEDRENNNHRSFEDKFETNGKDTSHHSARFVSSRGKMLDEEMEKLKESVRALELDVIKRVRRSPGKAYRTNSVRERSEFETSRREIDSEFRGMNGKLLEQMESLKDKLDYEMDQRSAKEHDLTHKNNQCERLQRQLDDANKRLNVADDRISELTTSRNKTKDRLREVTSEHESSLHQSKSAGNMERILEDEMQVRVRVETELHNLQQLVDREMGDFAESRQLLETKSREIEELRSTNLRLEKEVYVLRGAGDKEKSHFGDELEQKERETQELRNQLGLVTSQLEREREQHSEQNRGKAQELNRLQNELQKLQKRIAELEALLEKAQSKHKHTDTETTQLRAEHTELESVKNRLETEVIQLQGRLRTVDTERERMITAIHDLQSQVDLLQTKSDTHAHSSDQERNHLMQTIRELQAQAEKLRKESGEEHERATKLKHESEEIRKKSREDREHANKMTQEAEELRKRSREDREHAGRLVGEVDETNLALDEVRQALEREVEIKKEQEREIGELRKMYEDEVKQWREKEVQWERERTDMTEQNYGFGQLTVERLQADIERIEQMEQDRNQEIEERDATIESLRERLEQAESAARPSSGGSGRPRDFEERMRYQVEGFQAQIKELCIQLEETIQQKDKEAKGRADAETGKKRLEKALLDLNAKLQATPTKADSQIASYKKRIAELEEENAQLRAQGHHELEFFEFDPALLEVENFDIEETDEQVRCRLYDIQRLLHRLNRLLVTNARLRSPIREDRVVEDEAEEEEEDEDMPNGDQDEFPIEEGEEEEGEEEEREEQMGEEERGVSPFDDIPTTPNGTRRVHFFTPTPPSTPPPSSSPPPAPLTPSTPAQPPALSPAHTPAQTSPLLPSNDAEKDRLENEWKRRVASSANKYTHSRIPLSSTKRLFPQKEDSSPKKPARSKTETKSKTEILRSSSIEKVSQTPPGPTPGFHYIPIKSDEIDEELSKIVSQTSQEDLTDIPKNFSRLDKGVYQFGTKKIHVQIRDGALVVRVGGGFMLFVEYLARHAKVENVKFQRSEARKRIESPTKEERPRELPKHNDTIQMGTLVRRGHKLMLVTKT